MTQQPEQVTPQRVITGRYVLLREIGRGGMGIVWLAEDRTIGRQVAIKELHLPAGVPPEERAILQERVLREARAAGRLNDPAVVTVYDVVQENGGTYIVMELIQAPTLSTVVNRDGPLPQHVVARLAEQLLSALESAHVAGIVHRDVKPSNILLFPNGRVKLTDFGIAQSTDDPRLTTSGVLVGSPSYIAPERIRGGEADPGSDLWALAAVLFFAVEGHSPFERSSTAATMHAILNEVPYLTRSHGPLASAIMGLLNTVPTARLSVAQVRGLLAQAGGTPPGGIQSLDPLGQTIGVGTGVGTAPYQDPTRLTTGPTRPRRHRWTVVAVVAALLAGLVGGWFGGRAVLAADTPADPARGTTMSYGQGGDIPVFALNNGACPTTRLQARRSYPSDTNTACDDPHEFEVLEWSLFGNDEFEYPAETLRPLAEAACSFLFASDYVVPEDKYRTLSYVTLVPTRRSWDDAANDDSDDGGNRKVYCLITSRDQRQLDGPQLRQD